MQAIRGSLLKQTKFILRKSAVLPQTAQGERVSLANSEQIPAGSTCEFEITCMDDAHEKAVMEWLDYGKLRGLGQWRNSGKGRFTYEILG